MAAATKGPFRIIGLPNKKRVQRFDMIHFEVEFDAKQDFFHLSKIGEENYHNAYDADEDYTLFRADAVFTHGGQPHIVPVFAAQMDRNGPWKWYVRFRPQEVGAWRLRIRVLSRHPASNAKRYEEHRFGFEEEDYRQYAKDAQRTFVVEDKKRLSGPLEKPRDGDNPNYFYRWTDDGGRYSRRPFFLFGVARPWATKASEANATPKTNWQSFLNRKDELFKPMGAASCNVLYHWMAPGETQLTHQGEDECWPKEELTKRAADEGYFTGFPGNKLSGSKMPLAYKRYDQGRALHTDNILNQARVTTRQGEEERILIFLVVMPHSLLQDGDGTKKLPDGSYPGHHWGEWAWKEHHPERKYKDPKSGRKKDIPSKLNGFHFFRPTLGRNLSIEQFFHMEPGNGSWENRLWKHFANYWRYIIARWTAHPALGGWVLMDELEGVGTDSTWWWDNDKYTYPWHDNLVQMMRGKLRWGTVEGVDLFYTGDYIKHPMTSSTTHYEGSSPDWYLPPHSARRNALQEFRKTGDSQRALLLIDTFGDLKDHANWRGNPSSKWKTDFVSHHAYQGVPYWGHWDRCYDKKKKTMQWKYWSNAECPLRDSKGNIKKDQYDFVLPNEDDTEFLAPNRWLWDSLCMRLRNWSRVNQGIVRVVTEYGCLERNHANERWHKYGKRVPALTHYANWAALALGLAGIPFKWNDGKEHGEMAAHPLAPKGSVWHRENYPVDNYAQIKSIADFLSFHHIPLHEMYHEELEIQEKSGAGYVKDTSFCAWALINKARTRIVVWIYDRAFTTNGRNPNRWLKINVPPNNQAYTCDWCDPWSGLTLVNGDPKRPYPDNLKPDSKGILRIPMIEFPTSNTNTVISDGNDIAIWIRKRGI